MRPLRLGMHVGTAVLLVGAGAGCSVLGGDDTDPPSEPVVVGMRLRSAERARRMSLAGRSTMVWVLVTSWIVVMEPCRMPSPSWITFTTGARQLVVQLAAVTR